MELYLCRHRDNFTCSLWTERDLGQNVRGYFSQYLSSGIEKKHEKSVRSEFAVCWVAVPCGVVVEFQRIVLPPSSGFHRHGNIKTREVWIVSPKVTDRCVTDVVTCSVFVAVAAHPTSFPVGTGSSSPGKERQGREVDHWPRPPPPPHLFMVWYLNTRTTLPSPFWLTSRI
jgi:hypothetical protein